MKTLTVTFRAFDVVVTLDHDLVLRKAGTLGSRDRKAVGRALHKLFASAWPRAAGA